MLNLKFENKISKLYFVLFAENNRFVILEGKNTFLVYLLQKETGLSIAILFFLCFLVCNWIRCEAKNRIILIVLYVLYWCIASWEKI